MLASCKKSLAFMVVLCLALGISANAQSGGSSTSVTGTVVDQTGAVVPNATVEIRNPVSAFQRTTSTDSVGKFSIPNVPFNPYHVTATAQRSNGYSQDTDVRAVVPVHLSISQNAKGSQGTVPGEAAGGDLIENR